MGSIINRNISNSFDYKELNLNSKILKIDFSSFLFFNKISKMSFAKLRHLVLLINTFYN